MSEKERRKNPEVDVENRERLRITAGGIVTNMNGDILLVQQKSGNWVFPKGGIDTESGEAPLVAAKREIQEETGIEDKDLERVEGFEAVYERPDTEKAQVVQRIQMFLFATKKMEVKPKPEFQDEIAEVRWVKKEEVVNLLTAPKDKEFFLGISNTF